MSEGDSLVVGLHAERCLERCRMCLKSGPVTTCCKEFASSRLRKTFGGTMMWVVSGAEERKIDSGRLAADTGGRGKVRPMMARGRFADCRLFWRVLIKHTTLECAYKHLDWLRLCLGRTFEACGPAEWLCTRMLYFFAPLPYLLQSGLVLSIFSNTPRNIQQCTHQPQSTR